MGQNGKVVCPGDMNNFLHMRYRAPEVPSGDREADVVENEVEQGLLNDRNQYDGNVHTGGKEYFWDEVENGKSVEVGGANKWIGLRNRIDPMPIAEEEPVVVENQEEQKLLDARNPYNGNVYLDGKQYFWNDIAAGKGVEVGGVNNWVGLRNRIEPMPTAEEEPVVV